MEILLAYGLGFCLPMNKLDFLKYFTCLEKLIVKLSGRIQSLAFNFFYEFKSYKVFSSEFSKSDIADLKLFASNKNIVVCKPDKGNGVVLDDKVRYVETMYSVISDQTKFKLITTPIHKFSMKIEDIINNFLRKLKKISYSVMIPISYSLLLVQVQGLCMVYQKSIKSILQHNFNSIKFLRPTGIRALVWQNSWFQF